MTLAVAGGVAPDDIDDFVDDWHDEDDGSALGDFLGMSEAECAAWNREPQTLPLIILARRAQVPLAEILGMQEARAQATQAFDLAGMDALAAWFAGTR